MHATKDLVSHLPPQCASIISSLTHTHENATRVQIRPRLKIINPDALSSLKTGYVCTLLLPKQRQGRKMSTSLSAANGTSIRTLEKRYVLLTLYSKPNQHYRHEFYLADVTPPILGATWTYH